MDFEAMKVSNLGGTAAELPESAECFSAILLKNSMSQSGPSPTKDDFLKRARFGARNRV
ncbi:MAG: hypothetical protein ABIK08_14965 [Pseudomonadota bacterium]